ncbi:hypothetical protein ACFVWL_08435 [Microbacterium sp. NPDC058269]|uniref:hypothetical protein n=1 Tax=Microbacterium sp. NPDC058269 TaxID=3346414 RepID=UPI0036DC8C57
MPDETELSRLHSAAKLLIAEYQSRAAQETSAADSQAWQERIAEVWDMLALISGTHFEIVSLRRHLERELYMLF